MVIVWDERKRAANFAKLGLDFASLSDSFFAEAVIGSAHSRRVVAVGRLPSGKTVTVIFVRLGLEGLSVLSLRPASGKERKRLDAS